MALLLPETPELLAVLPWRSRALRSRKKDPLLLESNPSVFLLLLQSQITCIVLQESPKLADANRSVFNICTVPQQILLPCSSLNDIGLASLRDTAQLSSFNPGKI